MTAKIAFYALRPADLAEHLGGTGRAAEPWRLLKAGVDPFRAGGLSAQAFARFTSICDDAPLTVAKRVVASCGTRKLGMALSDGSAIETVLIPGITRTTVCVSSQVGCARGCSFCVTATLGLVRSLFASEMTGQVKLALDEARTFALPPVRNVVFMGMGEPLDNLDEVNRALGVLTDPMAFEIAPGHVTVSTVGTSPKAILAASRFPSRLAWSIHAVDDGLRRKLVPTSRHSVLELRAAFLEALGQKCARLFVEMTLMRDVNDSVSDARALAEFLSPFRPKARVNVIPMNPGRTGHEPSPLERAMRFGQVLRDQGYFCAIRRARGAAEFAACGQLGIDGARGTS